MSYELIILPRAEKELRKLPQQVLLKIDEAILALSDNPRPHLCKKLTGFADIYRIKVSDYRVLYRIEDKQLIIEVIRVANRKDAYKRL